MFVGTNLAKTAELVGVVSISATAAEWKLLLYMKTQRSYSVI